MKSFFYLFIVCILSVGSAPAALAKPLSQILADSGLSPEDFNIMMATAKTLYDTSNPRPGKVVAWSNKSSGSHGKVRLASIHGSCAYIQHFVYTRGSTKPNEIRTSFCKSADGSWLRQA